MDPNAAQWDPTSNDERSYANGAPWAVMRLRESQEEARRRRRMNTVMLEGLNRHWPEHKVMRYFGTWHGFLPWGNTLVNGVKILYRATGGEPELTGVMFMSLASPELAELWVSRFDGTQYGHREVTCKISRTFLVDKEAGSNQYGGVRLHARVWECPPALPSQQ